MINRFKEQREKHGVTLDELAERTGVSVKELEEIESTDYPVGELSGFTAAHIAESLGCLISELIYPER